MSHIACTLRVPVSKWHKLAQDKENWKDLISEQARNEIEHETDSTGTSPYPEQDTQGVVKGPNNKINEDK